jgi:hypothetical protein
MKPRWFAPLALVLACSGESPGRVDIPTMDECHALSDRVLCDADTALRCQGGTVAERDDCANRGLLCAVGVGCRACEPSSIRCDGAMRYRCAADGSAETRVEECPANLQCSPGGCKDLCTEAVLDRSYLGCDYWPVFTTNSELAPDFLPAVAVGNGNLVPAHVIITRAGAPVAELDVPAQSAQTVELAADPALKKPQGSLLVRGAAYHLQASVPVTVHQFNPLKFELPFDCTDPTYEPSDETKESLSDGKCNSFTNDASLLFPSTALAPDVDNGMTSVEYFAMSRATFVARPDSRLPGKGLHSFVAISGVGTARAHVRVESSAFVAASAPGTEVLRALSPGDALEVDLDPGDVLQLVTQLPTCLEGDANVSSPPFCDPGPRYDLTGTHIVADGAVQVISGHDCSNVPFNRRACDHLEESMTPVATWGTTAVLSLPRPSAGGQYMLRVMSGADGNTITFEPPLHEPITLARGQTLEFLATSSLRVRGSNRILAAQYLLGGMNALVGDPSLSIAVPVDQYRPSYNFLSPSTYTQNVVDVIALDGDTILIDGKLVTGFEQVGSTRYRVASVPLPAAGAHEARGTLSSGFGIVLYGLGSYTSYMLPGGLALKPIVIGF